MTSRETTIQGRNGNPLARRKPLKYLIITRKNKKMAIRSTKRTSAAGPDGIRMAVYSEACSHILRPLQAFFNSINTSGNIPANFKIARVIMIHKKNSKQDMGNYRPISMENHIAKIWERVLNSRLMMHLNRHNRLTRRQHGFRPKRGAIQISSKLKKRSFANQTYMVR